MAEGLNLRAVLSDKCNYRCVFCSHDFNRSVNLDVPVRFLCRCIQAFASLGGRKVTYTGGEPLIFPGLMQVLTLAKSLGLTNSITTNGALLHLQGAEFFRLVDALNVSVPSFDEHEYTELTGGPSLECVKESAVMASSLGLKVKINCVYSLGREVMIDEMIDYFAPHGIIIKLMNDMLADVDYYSEFLNYTERFRGDPRVEVEGELNPGYSFCEGCSLTRKFSCPSCRSIWVYPNGKITLCPFDDAGSYSFSGGTEIYGRINELMYKGVTNYDRQKSSIRAVY